MPQMRRIKGSKKITDQNILPSDTNYITIKTMYNLDSLSLKYLIEENKDFLNGAVVQKIQMLSKREILLSIRNLGENRKLYINVDPKFAHINFITDKDNYFIKIPPAPPMFCMLLRKHLEGGKLDNIRVVDYERIVEFYFDIYDEIGSLIPMCLSVELMGKHSNVILYNAKTKVITGCVHNISPEKSSVREVWGGVTYIYPPKQEKTDILKSSIADFYTLDTAQISDKYYYFSKGLTDFILKKAAEAKKEELFSLFQNLAGGNKQLILEFWAEKIKEEGLSVHNCRTLNGLIEKYFSYFVLKDLVQGRKNTLLRQIQKEFKRNNDIILNSDKKSNYLAYKEKGDLILANIYKINKGDKILATEGFEIILDENKTPSENAQWYFALYSKGKKAKEVLEKRKLEAEQNIQYLNEILFTIKNADRPDILDEIEDEISEFSGKNTQNIKGKKENKPDVKCIEYQGFKLYLGKNNKQNDYLIRKLSNPEDIWLHTKDCPSGHIIIKTENGKKAVTDEVLLYAAKLVKENSSAKESSKVSIIYTKRKYLKRPPETHLGYVTYKEEKEIVI